MKGKIPFHKFSPSFKNLRGVEWHNLHENLGSDRYTLAATIPIRAAPPRELKVTDWYAFRKMRKEDKQICRPGQAH